MEVGHQLGMMLFQVSREVAEDRDFFVEVVQSQHRQIAGDVGEVAEVALRLSEDSPAPRAA